MSEQKEQERSTYVPAKRATGEYPLIDSDPHFMRVVRYLRPSDYAVGAATASAGPALFWAFEKHSPSYMGKGGFASMMRLNVWIGVGAGFFMAYQRSSLRFYGVTENRREIDMDMREMTDKVKRGEPLYGVSEMSEYMQGVASRNSRYSAVAMHMIPWFNFVNHNHHGVDTKKYYQNAERELEAERTGKVLK